MCSAVWLTKAVVFTKLHWWVKKLLFYCYETKFDAKTCYMNEVG